MDRRSLNARIRTVLCASGNLGVGDGKGHASDARAGPGTIRGKVIPPMFSKSRGTVVLSKGRFSLLCCRVGVEVYCVIGAKCFVLFVVEPWGCRVKGWME
ncbi:hypothetical protein NPIL_396451 [Nephila pilipes]|uniref:Uncharacterized protein n=1 Tax=Nephila pilipes TaxID=299642 RepID=A0A8X6M6Q1_NEPPI|nr:hypothetical protein NPIL_396451 [Nephila pilipes]